METGLLLLLPSLVWPLRVPVPLKITDAESGANLSSNSKKYPVPSGSFLSVPGDQSQALWGRERWSPLYRIILVNCMDVSLLCNLISGPLSPFIFQSLEVNRIFFFTQRRKLKLGELKHLVHGTSVPLCLPLCHIYSLQLPLSLKSG